MTSTITSLFKKLGIAVPPDHRLTSVNQLIGITNTLHKAGYQGVAIAGESGFQASWMVDSYLDTSATPAQYDDYLTSWEPNKPVTLPFTAAPLVKTLWDAIQAMGKAGVFQTGFLGVTALAQSEALFVSGKTGMLLDGEWAPGTGLKSATFPYDWLLLPPVNGSTEKNKLSLFVGDTIGIPTKAQNPAAALNFAALALLPKVSICDLKADELPSIKGVPAADYSMLPPVQQSQVADVKVNGSQYGWSSSDPAATAMNVDPLVQAMLSGQDTPQQVVQNSRQAYSSTELASTEEWGAAPSA